MSSSGWPFAPERGRETRAAVDGGFTKVAWIHDGPPGVASLGHFNCPCGNRISEVEYAGPQDNPCGQCGRVWDSRGWLVTEGSGHDLQGTA